MTAKSHVFVVTGDPVEVNRLVVQGRAAGISVQLMNDSRETFAGMQREIEALHNRIHKLNSELAFLTEKVTMMCMRMVRTLGDQEEAKP